MSRDLNNVYKQNTFLFIYLFVCLLIYFFISKHDLPLLLRTSCTVSSQGVFTNDVRRNITICLFLNASLTFLQYDIFKRELIYEYRNVVFLEERPPDEDEAKQKRHYPHHNLPYRGEINSLFSM